MIDTLLAQRARFDPAVERERLGLPETYGVVTLHRPSNVDDEASARAVVAALDGLSALLPLVIPLHPRGRATLEAAGLRDGDRLRIVEPLGYVAFLSLVAGARLVLTDSGGIQEETTILDVPCLTMRPNTERPITVSHGTNRLVAPDEVVAAAREILAGPVRPTGPRPPLWDGHAGERIADEIVDWLARRAPARRSAGRCRGTAPPPDAAGERGRHPTAAHQGRGAPAGAARAARGGLHRHRPALGRGDGRHVLRRARVARAGPEPRDRWRDRGGADRADAGRAGRRAAGRRPGRGRRLRRHELDARGDARRRQAGRAGRARGGRAALVRPADAGGDQPDRDRPPGALVLRPDRGRRGQPRGRGARRWGAPRR